MLVDLIILIPTIAMLSFFRYCIIKDSLQNTHPIPTDSDTDIINQYDKEKDL